MLFDIYSEKPIKQLPHASNFNLFVSRLIETEFDAILNELDSMVDGDEVHTAGWMPGKIWAGTPFESIYEDACLKNVEVSGMCFGLFVFLTFMDRPEAWACGRYEKDGVPIHSMTYFRIPRLDHKVPAGHGRGASGYVWRAAVKNKS